MVDSLKYFWLFYFVFVILLCLACFEQHWLWYLLTALCTGRILWMGPKFQGALCIVCVLFFWRVTSFQTELTHRQQFPLSPSDSMVIQVDPHDLTLSQDMIRGEGILFTEKQSFPIQWYSREKAIIDQFHHKPLHHVEKWHINGAIQEITPALNFNVFDYQVFQEKKGIYHSIELHEITKRQMPQDLLSRWTSLMYQLKLPLMRHDAVWVHLHNRLLFRLDDEATSELMDLMSVWGVVHLFSISGMQVHWLRKKGVHLLAWAGMRLDRASWLVEGALFFYGWIIGWPIGILRALATYYLRMIVGKWHWPLSRLDQIACVGMVLLWIDPLQLYSLGFQLSFGLTLMMHLFMYRYPDFHSLTLLKQQGLLTSLSMLIVWPVMMRLTHQWYPLQWVMSLIVSYFFSDYLLGMMVITSVLLYTGLGDILPLWDYLSEGLSFFYEWAIYLNPIKWFELTTGHLPTVSFLILLTCPVIYLYQLKQSPRHTMAIITVIYCMVLFVMPHLSSDAVLTILYVGQGDAMLVQMPHRRETWLIDTGGRMNWGEDEGKMHHDEASRYLIPALKALGVKQLTGVLITHPDIDHMGNLVGLAEVIPIRHMYLTEYTAQSELFKTYLSTLQKVAPKIHYHLVKTEQRQTLIKGVLEVVAEDPDAIYSGDDISNRTSIISTLRFHGRTILSLGDITATEEEKYVSYFQMLEPEMIKLAHHGSHTGTSETLLKELQAKWAFISAGQNNRYGHPHPEVLQRLNDANVAYLSTSEMGAIQITIQSNGDYTIQTRQQPDRHP